MARYGKVNDYHENLYLRDTTPEQIQDIFDAVRNKPLPAFTVKELKDMLKPLQREARARVSELRKTGLDVDSPAARYLKHEKISLYKPRNETKSTYMKAVRDMVNFLSSKTSLVEHAEVYSAWVKENIGDLPLKERRKIWKNIHNAEKEFSNHHEILGYGYVIKRVSEITKDTNFKVFSPSQLGEIMNRLMEEHRASIFEAQKGVEMDWTREEDLMKEYDSL